MAQGYYEKLYKAVKSGNDKSIKSALANTTSGKKGSLQKKIDNLSTRLNAGGVDTSDKEDTRNPIEKFLGLPEDQNFIFDFFELINRPQQALFGAIDALQTGGDVLGSAWDNLRGEKETSFKKILNNAGLADSEGFDLSDALGFVGDVLLDPMDLALIPVTGGANVAAQAVDTAGDIAKGAKAADTISDIAKGANALDNVSDAVRTGVKFKSGNDLLFEGIGKGIKGLAKGTDNLIEKALTKSDELAGITYKTAGAKDAANLGKTIAEGAKRTIGNLETYKDIKNQISRAFSTVASIPKEVMDKIRKNNADSVRAANELKVLYEGMDGSITDYAYKVAEKLGDTSEATVRKIAEQADKDIANLKEFMNLDREVTMKNVIKEALNGKLKYTDAGDDIVKKLNDIASDVNKAGRGLNLTVDVTDNGLIKLNGGWNYIRPTKKQYNKMLKEFPKEKVDELTSLMFDENKLAEKVVKKGSYTQKDLDEFGKLLEKYNNDADFQKLFQQNDDVFNKANGILDKYFGTNLVEKYADNAGYVRHAFNKDQFEKYKQLGFVNEFDQLVTKGNTKVLGDRLYNMSAREANNMFKESISKNLDTLSADQRKAVNKLLKEDGIFSEGLVKSFGNYLENVPKLAQESKTIDTVLVNATFGDFKELKDIDKQITGIEKYIKNGGKTWDKDSKGIKRWLTGEEITKDTDLGSILDKLKTKKAELLNNSNMKLLTNADSTIPRGFAQLSEKEVNDLSKKLYKMSDELGLKDMQELSKYVKNNGGRLAINKDILRLVEINTDKAGQKGFVRLYDKYLNFFKRNKVLSPSFQINNLLGNTSNMYLAGIGATKQAKLFPEAFDIMSKSGDLMKKAAAGIELTGKEQDMLKIWNGFLDAGFGDPKSLTALELADMPDSLKKYFKGEKEFKNVKDFIVDGLPYLNNKMNNYMDTMARLATYIEGINNPKFLDKLGVETAGEAVRKVLFDPKDLTEFERNTMKRIIPFYTFTKKNLAFQFNNLSKNGSQYSKLIRGYNRLLDSATDNNSENVSDWLKENLYIPIPSLGEDGSYKVIRGSLPFGNVIDTLENPMEQLVNLSTPLLKMPFELATNTNSFTKQDIEKFPGQLSNNIPGLTKKQEYLLSNLTGLDTPIKNLTRAYDGIQETMRGEANPFKFIENAATIDNNINIDEINKMYEQLERLKNTMQQYKQRGYQFSTMNELKQANKNISVQGIMSRLNKLNGVRANPYMQQYKKMMK